MRSNPMKPRWRGFWNSVTEGSLNELLVGGSGSGALAETPLEDGALEHEIPFGRLRAGFRFAQDDKFRGFSKDRPQSKLFEVITRELLGSGNGIRFQARGASMSPAIRDGEVVHVKSVAPAELRKGEIVLVKGEMGFRLHRLVVADAERDVFITRGDCGQQDDPAVSREEIVGIAVAKEVRVGRRIVRAKLKGTSIWLVSGLARGQRVLTKCLRRVMASASRERKLARVNPGVLGLLFVLLAATFVSAQVTIDSTSSGSATLTGAGNPTLSVAHTT